MANSKLDTLQLEKLIAKVDNMDQRHSLEIQELTQHHQTSLFNKEREMQMHQGHLSKDNRRLKDTLKNKNEELDHMKIYLEEIEDDLKRLKWI